MSVTPCVYMQMYVGWRKIERNHFSTKAHILHIKLLVLQEGVGVQ